jgi:RNA polymerase sigma factor (sigma-70 family)
MLFLANTIKPFIHLAENWSDLFQEGYIGMLNAYKNYDETKGYPGSYAKVVIQRAVAQYLRKEAKFSIDKYVEVNDFKNMDKPHKVKNEEDLYDQLFREEDLKYEVKQVIDFASWPDREKDILEKSYGLNGQEEHNTQQIANHHSLTRSRINQIKCDLKKDIKKRKTLKLFI